MLKNKNKSNSKNRTFSIVILLVSTLYFFTLVNALNVIENAQKEGMPFEDGVVSSPDIMPVIEQKSGFLLENELNTPSLLMDDEHQTIFVVDSLPGQTFEMELLFRTKEETRFVYLRNLSQDIVSFKEFFAPERNSEFHTGMATPEQAAPLTLSVQVPENAQGIVEAILLERSGTQEEFGTFAKEDMNQTNSKQIKIMINIK